MASRSRQFLRIDGCNSQVAFGERHAVPVTACSMSLGIGSDRVRTVNYGKNVHFGPGHDEGAWAKIIAHIL